MERVRCDQLIYTAAEIDGVRGFQVVAKSEGITREELEHVMRYILPKGLSPEQKFDQSRSLFRLPSGRLSVSLVKNIGTGYDGREGTLYNHTLILSQEDYQRTGLDPEPFWQAIDQLTDPSMRGHLPLLAVQVPDRGHEPSFNRIKTLEKNRLRAAIQGVLAAVGNPDSRVVISSQNRSDQESLPRDLLMLLPQSLRLLPFSTYVLEYEEEARAFNLMITPNAHPNLPSSELWALVDLQGPSNPSLKIFRGLSESLAHVVQSQDPELLNQIHAELESLPLDSQPRQCLEYVDLKLRLERETDPAEQARLNFESALNPVIPHELKLHHLRNAIEDSKKVRNPSLYIESTRQLLSLLILTGQRVDAEYSTLWSQLLGFAGPAEVSGFMDSTLELVPPGRQYDEIALGMLRELIDFASSPKKELAPIVGLLAAKIRDAILARLQDDPKALGDLVLRIVRLGNEMVGVDLLTSATNNVSLRRDLAGYAAFADQLTNLSTLQALSSEGIDRTVKAMVEQLDSILDDSFRTRKSLMDRISGSPELVNKQKIAAVQQLGDRLVFPLWSRLVERDQDSKSARKRLLEKYRKAVDLALSEA